MDLSTVISIIGAIFSIAGLSVAGMAAFYIDTKAEKAARRVLKEHVDTHCKEHKEDGQRGFDNLDKKLDRILDHLLNKK